MYVYTWLPWPVFGDNWHPTYGQPQKVQFCLCRRSVEEEWRMKDNNPVYWGTHSWFSRSNVQSTNHRCSSQLAQVQILKGLAPKWLDSTKFLKTNCRKGLKLQTRMNLQVKFSICGKVTKQHRESSRRLQLVSATIAGSPHTYTSKCCTTGCWDVLGSAGTGTWIARQTVRYERHHQLQYAPEARSVFTYLRHESVLLLTLASYRRDVETWSFSGR